MSVSETLSVSVPGIGEGSETAEVGIKGTLSSGVSGDHTFSREVGWGEEVEIPGNSIGKFKMVITRGEVRADFKATVTARLKDDENHLAFADNFQGFNNVFDFNYLTEADRVWEYRGSLHSDSSFDINTEFSHVPIRAVGA